LVVDTVPAIPESRHRPAPPRKYGASGSRPGGGERGERRGDLADPESAQLVGSAGAVAEVDGQSRPLRADHLALLAERARHDQHLGAFGQIPRDRAAGGDGLVVGVRVDEQDAAHQSPTRCQPGVPAKMPSCTGPVSATPLTPGPAAVVTKS
jgi:hypothetical protein